MVTIHETNLDEIDLLTLDMPAVKKGNTPWEPLYSFFTPKELNERAQEIAIQEIINQQIIFEALQYSLMASVGCGRTA